MTASGWHRKDPALNAARKRQYNSAEHKQARARMRADVEAGVAHCWRCRGWIPPGSQWHAGHDDFDRSVYRGPEHASCNVRGAASKAARMNNARRRGASRAAPNGDATPRRSRSW